MSDLIERQAAVDAIYHHFPSVSITRARTMLHEVPSAQQWIPCSERLPRQGQEVICQCRANMTKVLKLDACGDWYQDAEHCYMSGFVIAWMPLPEPYRAERRTDEADYRKE